jgi:hypothetical protein
MGDQFNLLIVKECILTFSLHFFHFKPPILLEYTGFDRIDLILCAEHIAEKVAVEPVTASNRHLIAVKKKYNTSKFLNISGDYSLPTLSGMH